VNFLLFKNENSTLARFMDLPVWPLRSWSHKWTQNEIQSLNKRLQSGCGPLSVSQSVYTQQYFSLANSEIWAHPIFFSILLITPAFFDISLNNIISYRIPLIIVFRSIFFFRKKMYLIEKKMTIIRINCIWLIWTQSDHNYFVFLVILFLN